MTHGVGYTWGVRQKDTPVFSRGKARQLLSGGGGRVGSISLPRTWRDRLPVGELVTSKLMGDPPPWRAGRAPPCEDEMTAAEIQAAQRAPLLAARRYGQ